MNSASSLSLLRTSIFVSNNLKPSFLIPSSPRSRPPTFPFVGNPPLPLYVISSGEAPQKPVIVRRGILHLDNDQWTIPYFHFVHYSLYLVFKPQASSWICQRVGKRHTAPRVLWPVGILREAQSTRNWEWWRVGILQIVT